MQEHIRCKLISLYKLWKLQFEPSDQHPRGGVQKGERRDLQKCDYPIQGWVQIVKLPNPSYPLDVNLMAQIEVSIVCTERLVCTCYVPVNKTSTEEDICINHAVQTNNMQKLI